MPVGYLAIEAIMTFRLVDLTVMADGAARAFVRTDLTGASAFAVASQPVEDLETSGDREPGAECTEILAIEFAVEGGDQQ